MLTLQNLPRLPKADYDRLDPVAVNYICAAGLPGAPAAPLAEYQKMVDALASHVTKAFHHEYPIFHARPHDFQHSLAVFQATQLLTALQRDVGIRYNPALIDDGDFFADSRNLFIHGVLETRLGTCSSLPRLYVTVG